MRCIPQNMRPLAVATTFAFSDIIYEMTYSPFCLTLPKRSVYFTNLFLCLFIGNLSVFFVFSLFLWILQTLDAAQLWRSEECKQYTLVILLGLVFYHFVVVSWHTFSFLVAILNFTNLRCCAVVEEGRGKLEVPAQLVQDVAHYVRLNKDEQRWAQS